MPGRCKFNDMWLINEQYKNWLLKVPANIYVARCGLCQKTIKLDSMGESSLKSHAKGHKHAARALANDAILVELNGLRNTSTTSLNTYFKEEEGTSPEPEPEPVACTSRQATTRQPGDVGANSVRGLSKRKLELDIEYRKLKIKIAKLELEKLEHDKKEREKRNCNCHTAK